MLRPAYSNGHFADHVAWPGMPSGRNQQKINEKQSKIAMGKKRNEQIFKGSQRGRDGCGSVEVSEQSTLRQKAPASSLKLNNKNLRKPA